MPGAGAAATAADAMVEAGTPAVVRARLQMSRLLLLPATKAACRAVAVVVAAAGASTRTAGGGAAGLGRLEAVAGSHPLQRHALDTGHRPCAVLQSTCIALGHLKEGTQTVRRCLCCSCLRDLCASAGPASSHVV